MNKRKFGMRVLNISQSRFGTYSHKNLNAYDLTGSDSGIDKFIATYPYEIIGVLGLAGTGFANTVMFYDKGNDVTLALTHQNDLLASTYYIGKKFKVGDIMYYEGKAGQNTGNHIHMEIGHGRQTKKVKIGDIWQLQNLINIEDYFYIDDLIIINDTKGIKFENKGGTQVNSGAIHIVRIDRDISKYDYMISIDGNKFGTPYDTTTMSGFSDKTLSEDGWEEVIATNGSIFYPYENAWYAEGLEKSRGTNNQPLAMSAVTKFINTMAMAGDYSGNLIIDIQSNIMQNLNNYYGAITGAYGIIKDGKVNTAGAEQEYERNNLFTQKSGRTIWGFDKVRNQYVVISIPGATGKTGYTGQEIIDYCLEQGLTDAICLDGGGSRWLRVFGKNTVTTTRPVKNSVLLYRKPKTTSPVEDNEPELSVKDEIKDLLDKLAKAIERL